MLEPPQRTDDAPLLRSSTRSSTDPQARKADTMQDKSEISQTYSKILGNARSSFSDACSPLKKGQLLENATDLRSKVVLVTGE